MKEDTEKIGLKKEDVLNRANWRNGVQAIAERMGEIWPSLLKGQYQIKTELLLLLVIKNNSSVNSNNFAVYIV